MEKEENGSATMTNEQQQWTATMRASLKMIPSKVIRAPDGGLRAILYRFISSTFFDGFITLVIVLNIGVMACDYDQIEDDPEVSATGPPPPTLCLLRGPHLSAAKVEDC